MAKGKPNPFAKAAPKGKPADKPAFGKGAAAPGKAPPFFRKGGRAK